MYGKSKVSDWRNLNTGVQHQKLVIGDVNLKFAVHIFAEQLFYKNYST